MNAGGLCAKGAGALQLVNNTRRIGAWAGTHPVNPIVRGYDADLHRRRRVQADRQRRVGRDGRSTRRMGEIATGMVTARGAVTDANGYNSKGVAFLGSFAHEQRAELHVPQADRELRHEQHRASGPYMTLVHGGRSGRRIRTRLDDEPLDRHGQLDERPRHGREPRREPPGVHRAHQQGARRAATATRRRT